MQPRDQVEQGGFAAAGVSDQRDEFAARNLEVDILERDKSALPWFQTISARFR